MSGKLFCSISGLTGARIVGSCIRENVILSSRTRIVRLSC